jgi:hypothetical protein
MPLLVKLPLGCGGKILLAVAARKVGVLDSLVIVHLAWLNFLATNLARVLMPNVLVHSQATLRDEFLGTFRALEAELLVMNCYV